MRWNVTTAASIRNRLGKLKKQAAPYQRELSDEELVERLLSWTQFWSDEDFLALLEELKAGDLSPDTLARLNEWR